MNQHSESIFSEDNSDTDCSSETCDSATNFCLVADTTMTLMKPKKGHQALQRNNQSRRNAHWNQQEAKRKSSKFYKIALLHLNDSDMISIPSGADHQVR